MEEVSGKNEPEGEDASGQRLETFNLWYQDLEFEEQMCFIFDCVPSKIHAVFWSHSYSDIQTKIKIVLGFHSVKFAQFHEALVKVGVMLLGGESKPDKPNPKDVPKTVEEAKSMFSNLGL